MRIMIQILDLVNYIKGSLVDLKMVFLYNLDWCF